MQTCIHVGLCAQTIGHVGQRTNIIHKNNMHTNLGLHAYEHTSTDTSYILADMHLYIRTARYIIIHDLIYYVYRHDTLYSVYTYMHIHMQWIYSMWDNVSLCNMLELEIYLAVWGAEGGRKRDAARDERRHRRIHRETRRRKETDRGIEQIHGSWCYEYRRRT